MKSLPKFILITLLLLLVKYSSAAEIEFSNGSYADILSRAKSENKIVMIDFVTDWCKWCIELDRKVYTVPEVSEFANSNQINWKIDAEKGEGIELAKKYQVKGFPTILFVDADGNEIDRIYGYYFAKDFLRMMKDYNSGINTFNSLKTQVEANPNDPVANYKFGEKLLSQGQRDGVDIYFTKAILLDPQNSSGYADDASFTLAYLKNDIQAMKTAINNFPESEKMKEAYLNLASLYEANKEISLTEETYKQAFDKYGSDDEEVRFNYGNYLIGKSYELSQKENATTNELADALKIANESLEYVKGSVNEASANYIISTVQLKLGNKAEALTAIETSLKIFDKKSYRDHKEKVLLMK